MSINAGSSEFCMPGWALVCFSERDVTRFGPVASTYVSMRYKKII